jgi:hypothetical protein
MSTLSLGADTRMREMMRRQQVDVLEFCYDEVGATFERARGACEQCVSVDACLNWLAANRGTGTPAFCPNDQLFGQFRVT